MPAYSIGWYCIAELKELNDLDVISKFFCGEEIVIFKTKNGNIGVMDAYCKHMGAHLAKGGKVENEELICPFHGFRFNCEGVCTKSGYDSQPDPKINSRKWPIKVMNGLIFSYYHPEKKEPEWFPELPQLENCSHYKFHHWKMNCNILDIFENTVDLGHFKYVHKYDDTFIVDPLKTEGHELKSSYGFHRKGRFGVVNELNAKFYIHLLGPGLGIIRAEVAPLDITTHHLILPTPIDSETITLRIGASLQNIEEPGKIHPLAKILPKSWLNTIIHNLLFKEFIKDVGMDKEVWENKIYIHPPLLADGDGPIIMYRKWAAQFDPRFQSELTSA